MASIPIVVFSDHSGRFIAGIEAQRGNVTVARHVHDMSEVFGLGQTGIVRAALLVADYTDYLTQSMVAQLHEVGVAVVAVTDPGIDLEIHGVAVIDALADTPTVIESIETAVANLHTLTFDRAPAADTAALSTTVTVEAAEALSLTSSEKGRVITVWGSTGAPGRTTVATHLAATLTAQGYSTVLVDADTYGPALGITLGLLDEYSGISQICHYADRNMLTDEKYREYVSSIDLAGKTLDIITGITRADRWPEVREKSFTSVLDYLRSRYQAVVIDTAFSLEADEEITFDGLAPRRNAAAITAVEQASDIVVVGSADVVGFPRLVRAFEELNQSHLQLATDHRKHVWINKMRSETTGSRGRGEVERAWSRFGPATPITGFIPHEPSILDKALLTGKTIVEIKDAQSLTDTFTELARSLMGAIAAGHSNATVVTKKSVLARVRHRLQPSRGARRG
ncbi:CpaE family protein [Rothia sp. ZJ932]|uniref:AAA family ATPase n=1 Tax=Rothia sp. ZJ932 TaxID=2810516 RepID=UPI001967AEC8|nr:P-loop NTPase [Rothia sp. ZJ932]QRZ61013.1 AAA family ATPase [Rothia sp. ZJ932]